MNTIGDLLSNAQKSNLILENVNKGNVFRLKMTDEEGVIPKNAGDDGRYKYFIVLGKDNEGNTIGTVLINSEINKNLPQHLKDLHYPIPSSKYQFLKKNSFVCCSSVKVITNENFVNRYEGENSFDSIDDEDLELIIGAIKDSGTVSNKIIKKYNLI